MSANWPRVSTILKVLDDTYNGVPTAVLEEAAARGERLHRLCLSYLGSVDGLCTAPHVASMAADDFPVYEAFRKWVTLHSVRPIAIEEPSQNRQYRYRGTPDALIQWGSEKQEALLDLKFTAAPLRTHRVQLHAYRRMDLYNEAKVMILLYLAPKDGRLMQTNVTQNTRDWSAFLNALSVWKWRQS